MVCVKRVVDYNVRIRVKPDGSGVVTDGVKMSMNPFDEIAVEEALRIRERGEAQEIIVVSIGAQPSQEQLRTALAMGADRAIHVQTEERVQPLTSARVLKALVDREGPDLVLMGKQAIDDDNNQTGQMLAALWERPQATFTSELNLSGGTAQAVREVDAGLEVIEFDLPAVVTVDLRLNEPRYVKLPDMMKAKRKTIESLTVSDLGIEAAPPINALEVKPPPGRQPGIKVENVEQLVAELQSRSLI